MRPGQNQAVQQKIDGNRQFASAYVGTWLAKEDALERTGKVFSKLALAADAALEEWEEMRKQSGDSHEMACKDGCDYCCRQPVMVTPLEVFALADWLKANLKKPDLDDLSKRASEYLNAMQKCEGFGEYPDVARTACPVLKDHRCSGYEARPFMCRAYHSFSLEQCIERFEHGDSKPVDHNSPALYAAVMHRVGAAQKIHEMGKPSPQVVLGGAIAIALTEKDVEQRWLNGENVFARAEVKSPNQA
ncbi:MAG: YkgJ family cysteine cluster protein [Armatimonadetes bacterium]|nr:YkgJ family cysteine cluster protein [Armatimonadota bacterium]